MILVMQAAIGHKIKPKGHAKLSPLKSSGTPKLSLRELSNELSPPLFPTQTNEFSRIPLNHSTPYIYTISDQTIPVNHCTPHTYINNPVIFNVTLSTPYTYTKNCARYVINPRQSSTPQYPYQISKTSPKLAKMPRQTPRPCKPTLNFTPSLLATTSCQTSTPLPIQDRPHPPKGSKTNSAKPPVHLEFW
jgi:hypothetical protein